MSTLIEAIARGIAEAEQDSLGDVDAMARAAILAIEASGTHVIVPVTITPEMNTALNSYAQCEGYIEEGYVAMIAARPKVTTS